MRNTTDLPTIQDFKRLAKEKRKKDPMIGSHGEALQALSREYGHKGYKEILPHLKDGLATREKRCFDLTLALGKHLELKLFELRENNIIIALKFISIKFVKSETLKGWALTVFLGHISNPMFDGTLMEECFEWLEDNLSEEDDAVFGSDFGINCSIKGTELSVWEKIGLKNVYIANQMPTAVLFKRENGEVIGFWGNDPHIGSIEDNFIYSVVEPEEVLGAIVLPTYSDALFGLLSPLPLKASSLEKALELMPVSKAYQRMVYLYIEKENDWEHGIWNSPEKDHWKAFSSTSLSELYGSPVSKKKLQKKEGLDKIDFKYEVPFSVLKEAYSLRGGLHAKTNYDLNYEEHPSLKTVCNYWNDIAPEEWACARTFRLYVWKEKAKSFLSCDPEEPAFTVSNIRDISPKAISKDENGNTVVLVFLKGIEDYSEDGAISYYVDGGLGYDAGIDMRKQGADESCFSYTSLCNLINVINS